MDVRVRKLVEFSGTFEIPRYVVEDGTPRAREIIVDEVGKFRSVVEELYQSEMGEETEVEWERKPDVTHQEIYERQVIRYYLTAVAKLDEWEESTS